MFCSQSVRWLYRLESSYSWDSGHSIPEDMAFRDRRGRVRLLVEQSGRITVIRGYSWNGCSPKLCLFDVVVGTPEGVVSALTGRPKTYYASLVHDALYQFLRDGLPLRRRDADRFFLRLMAETRFAPRCLYWLAVRLFGWLVLHARRRARHWQGRGDVIAG